MFLSSQSIADEEFGLTVDEKLKKEVIIDQLIRISEERSSEARTLNEQAAALFLSADPNERLINVKFLPQDFTNASIGKDTKFDLAVNGFN